MSFTMVGPNECVSLSVVMSPGGGYVIKKATQFSYELKNYEASHDFCKFNFANFSCYLGGSFSTDKLPGNS